MARKRRISPEKIGRLLKRSREELGLSMDECCKEFSGPDRKTLRKWESGEGLKQLLYVVRLAQRSPLLATNLLFYMDPEAERAFLSVPRRYLVFEELRRLRNMDGVVLLPNSAAQNAAARYDANAAWEAAPTARAIPEWLDVWVNQVGHEDVDPDSEVLEETIQREERLMEQYGDTIQRVDSRADSRSERIAAIDRQMDTLREEKQHLLKMQAYHAEAASACDESIKNSKV